MQVDDTVPSPLGELRFTVTVGTSGDSPGAASTHVRGDKVRFGWEDVDGAAISLLRVPLPVDCGLQAVAGWGLLWTVAATRNLGPIRVDMLLSTLIEGERWRDEFLDHYVHFADADWELKMGGDDDEGLVCAASAGILPREWVAPLGTELFGVDTSCAQKLGYVLPGLTSGQQFRVASAVAWARAHGDADDAMEDAITTLLIEAHKGLDG